MSTKAITVPNAPVQVIEADASVQDSDVGNQNYQVRICYVAHNSSLKTATLERYKLILSSALDGVIATRTLEIKHTIAPNSDDLPYANDSYMPERMRNQSECLEIINIWGDNVSSATFEIDAVAFDDGSVWRATDVAAPSRSPSAKPPKTSKNIAHVKPSARPSPAATNEASCLSVSTTFDYAAISESCSNEAVAVDKEIMLTDAGPQRDQLLYREALFLGLAGTANCLSGNLSLGQAQTEKAINLVTSIPILDQQVTVKAFNLKSGLEGPNDRCKSAQATSAPP